MPFWVPGSYFQKIWFVKVVGPKMISANKYCTTHLKIYPNHSFQFQQKLFTGIQSRTNIDKDKDKDINSDTFACPVNVRNKSTSSERKAPGGWTKNENIALGRNSKGKESLRSNFYSLSASSGYNFFLKNLNAFFQHPAWLVTTLSILQANDFFRWRRVKNLCLGYWEFN